MTIIDRTSRLRFATQRRRAQKKIFYFSDAAQRAFTRNEWIDYVRTHNTTKEVVMSCNGYDFTIHDVCINPKEVVKHEQNHRYKFSVDVCEPVEGRFVSGWHYDFYNSGGGGSPTALHEHTQSYASEREAVFAALCFIYNHAKREYDSYISSKHYDDEGNEIKVAAEKTPTAQSMRTFIAALDDYKGKFNPKQLSIFDIIGD